jgi:hypothetical protein
LQQLTIMPFIMQQRLHMAPDMLEQRFCKTLHAILSSQLQTIFIPPVVFSILIVHWGTIKQFMAGAVPAIGIPMPVGMLPDALIGFIIAVIITRSPSGPPDQPPCLPQARPVRP